MDISTIVRHLIAVKQYTTASYGMAIYEYIITLDREVDTFWRRRISLVTALWFLNRYTLIFSIFPTIIGFYYPYTQEVSFFLSSDRGRFTSFCFRSLFLQQCFRFVKFPGAMQIISNIASGLTLSLRVYALYGQAGWVIGVLLPVFVAEIALESWAVAGGVPAVFPDGVVGCILTGKDDQGIRFATFWIGQLVFPTLIFVMTITRALRLRKSVMTRHSILTVLLRDGTIYFLVIFFANTVNVLTYIIAPEDLRFANAPFTNVITTVMICRLMLNLQQEDGQTPSQNDISTFAFDRGITQATSIGSLAEDMSIGSQHDYNRKKERHAGTDTGDWRGGERLFKLHLPPMTTAGSSYEDA